MPQFELLRDAMFKAAGAHKAQPHRAGSIVEYSDPPLLAMKPLDQAAREAKARSIPPDLLQPRATGRLSLNRHRRLSLLAQTLGIEWTSDESVVAAVRTWKDAH